MTLSTRIAAAVGVTSCLLVMAAGWLVLRLVGNDLRDQQDEQLRRRAAAVSRDARALLRLTDQDRPGAAERLRERRLYASALDIGIRLVGPEETVTAGPQPREAVPLPQGAAVPTTLRTDDGDWRVLSVPVTVRRTGTTGTLWLFAPDPAGRDQLRLVRRRVVTVALLAAPVAGALGWAVTRGAVRPLRRLQQRTSGLDPRNSAARLHHTPTRITEVDDLALTLQTVLARYDEQAARTGEALATARSFSAAASHELRTPLMSMRTNLDVLAGHPDLDPSERAEVVDDLRGEHERLLGLLRMLRALARGDLVEEDALVSVDLGELADGSACEARARHPEAEITVSGASGLRVHGWEPGLRSLVGNLLANGLTHGRIPGQAARVTVTLTRGNGREAVLTVDDEGPGIPPDQRDAVFQRFRRGPDSPGSGLGLTLVAQQVALHRGRVRLLEGPGGRGTRVEVRIPVAGDVSAGAPGGTPDAPLPAPRDWLSRASAGSQEFHKDDL